MGANSQLPTAAYVAGYIFQLLSGRAPNAKPSGDTRLRMDAAEAPQHVIGRSGREGGSLDVPHRAVAQEFQTGNDL